ncbi:MAG: Gfo/Idh/MocA family oxidoreductase [Caldilineaceae bacterium]
MSTPTNARIAVIGAGWWATTAQIPAVLEHPDATLAALCDRAADKLATAAAAYNIAKTYTDLQTMLAQEPLDGAIIVTNHASHYPTAKLCLEHGLHIG